MTERDFCYFMQSLFEVADMKTFNEEQTKQIREHLALVFVHKPVEIKGPDFRTLSNFDLSHMMVC